ncbi:MAG: Na(+)-translocating NADH-quinone reductase subunit C [Planctomycetia bacterium]|nr:Na(+)-translocating NADH-quinone reductase subunit C [Planctomycetia bacterium]
MSKDSILKTFIVALVICLLCAITVSWTATKLKPRQEENKMLDRQTNVLKAAGLVDAKESPSAAKVKELFAKVDAVVVNLDSGRVRENVKPEELRERLDPIPKEEDFAGIKERPDEVVVYLVKNDSGVIDSVILPIYGRGLWSVMYGFLALSGDFTTVKNVTFYDHGETPGLGGEISNPSWTGKWTGKTALDGEGLPVVHIIKGNVDPTSDSAAEEIDGISGATLTCNGVNGTIRYWLGEYGFGEYLKNLKSGRQ